MMDKKMKRVLIITYYFPPMGGSGVQRWTKFVKYFRDFGLEPIVYCPKNPEFALQDSSLLNDIPKGIEVLKTPIFEPLKILNFFAKKNMSKINIGETGSDSIIKKILFWIRANLFIPDPRVFWINTSVIYLTKYLKNNPNIDTIITTAPPHSINLIGYKLKKKLNLKWIMDLRDPWKEYIYDTLPMISKPAINIHKSLENKCILSADKVITTSYELTKLYKEEYNINNIETITNGYDSDDFVSLNTKISDKFIIIHSGLLDESRYNDTFFLAIKELVEYKNFRSDVRIKLIGTVSSLIQNKIHKYNIDNNVDILGYIPHNKLISMQNKASLLLLLSEENRPEKLKIEGKLYEYLALKKTILAITHIPSDVSKIINDTNTGIALDFNDKKGIKEFILKEYDKFKKGAPKSKCNHKEIEKYSRKKLTEKMSFIIKKG